MSCFDGDAAGGAQSRFSGELNAADSHGPSSFVINTYAGAPWDRWGASEIMGNHGQMVPVVKPLSQTSSFEGIQFGIP